MIKIDDELLVREQGMNHWYRVQIEVFPCRMRWNHGHRYFAEVMARKTDWPKEDQGPYMWNHYYQFDYTTWTLRGAWFKAHKVIDKLNDYVDENPDDRPD